MSQNSDLCWASPVTRRCLLVGAVLLLGQGVNW
ncbi:MAG: hypothetical protein JWM11_6940, partial [Planctomycetaceae bacterium]|nr:hypothetical protein [Planctomycetaceae bacterium]